MTSNMTRGIRWAIIAPLAAAALLTAAVVVLSLLLAGEQREVERATSETETVAAELAATQSALEDERSNVRQVRGELDSKTQALEETQRELRDTTRELSANIEALEQERDTLESSIHALEQAGRREQQSSTQQARALSSNIDALEQERDGLDSKVLTLEQTGRELETRIRRLSANVAALEKERDDLKATIVSMRQDRSELHASYLASTLTSARLQSEVQSLDSQVQSLDSEVLSLGEQIRRLERENEAFKLSYESVAKLEERAAGLRAVIGGLEDDRKALVVKSREMFPVCTGSMEPKITCLDTVVLLENFFPKDIATGTLISFYPPGEEADDAASPILHRVEKIMVEDGVYHFWPRGDALDEPDGYWVPADNVVGYALELVQGTRPENSALRDRVNGARARFVATRDTMLEARQAFDETATQYCGSVQDAATCRASQNDFAKVTNAFNAFSRAWIGYVEATCEYNEAYYYGKHESEPRSSEPFDPYVAPAACS